MKIRSGFVSNSSSSSFIILLSKLTDEQKQMIYDHVKIGKKVDEQLKLEGKEPRYRWYEEWDIKEDDFSLWAFTSMDNFYLKTFVVNEVGLSRNDIIPFGDGDYWSGNDLYECSEYNQLKRSKKISKITKRLGDGNL